MRLWLPAALIRDNDDDNDDVDDDVVDAGVSCSSNCWHISSGSDGAVAEVQRIRAERKVRRVVIDPHSPGATLIRPLTRVGVRVTEPSTSDVGVAYGLFLDELKAGRLKHSGQRELTEAVRFGTQRPLGWRGCLATPGCRRGCCAFDRGDARHLGGAQ